MKRVYFIFEACNYLNLLMTPIGLQTCSVQFISVFYCTLFTVNINVLTLNMYSGLYTAS